jgi:hypothetical protein
MTGAITIANAPAVASNKTIQASFRFPPALQFELPDPISLPPASNTA